MSAQSETGSAAGDSRSFSLVVISAGTSNPSSTRLLADQIGRQVAETITDSGAAAQTKLIELRPLATDIVNGLVSGLVSQNLQKAIDTLAHADGIVAVTPIYKAGVSGLFKSFVDVLDNDLLIAKPVLLAATAGTARHALVPDESMRSLFAYLRAIITPTSVFSSSEDWGSSSLNERVERAATELAALITSNVSQTMTGNSWGKYQHTFGSNAAGAAREADDISLDSDMMRLAAGGGS